MIHRQSNQSGFTAVELLVTLFVAAAFLIAGYQLFDVIIRDGGDTRAEARASNVAYDYLRRYSESASNPCTPSTPLASSAITAEGLDTPIVTVQITCPQPDAASISKVEVTVVYGEAGDGSTKHSTYIDKSRSTAATTEVTDGLIGWWKLNGSGGADAGPAVIVSNADSAVGQSGLPNTAYSFNQTLPLKSLYTTSMPAVANTNVTLSMWVNNPTATNSGAFLKVGSVGYGVGIGGATFDNNAPGTKIVMLYEGVRWIPTTTDLGTGWNHVVMTINSSGVPSAYKNGTLVSGSPFAGGNATGTNTLVAIGTGTNPVLTGATATRSFTGTVDDVRIYNRVLTGPEITTLYTGGAR